MCSIVTDFYYLWSVDDTGSPNYHWHTARQISGGSHKVAGKLVVLIQDPANRKSMDLRTIRSPQIRVRMSGTLYIIVLIRTL